LQQLTITAKLGSFTHYGQAAAKLGSFTH